MDQRVVDYLANYVKVINIDKHYTKVQMHAGRGNTLQFYTNIPKHVVGVMDLGKGEYLTWYLGVTNKGKKVFVICKGDLFD